LRLCPGQRTLPRSAIAAVPSIGRAAHVERAARDADATQDLYERYSGQIFGFCVNTLGSRDEAEDALQSTFLNAHRALQRGVTPEAELAWLFKIAHNVCLTRRRSTRRRGRVESPSDFAAVQDVLPAPSRESPEDLLRLTDALAHMPDNQRRAILLREWQGLSYHEIADELKLSQSAVETLIFRARRTLASNLESESTQPSKLSRMRKALDAGMLLAAFKGLFEGGAAAKVAAVAVAASGTVVVATAPPAPFSKPTPQKQEVASVALAAPTPVRFERRSSTAAARGDEAKHLAPSAIAVESAPIVEAPATRGASAQSAPAAARKSKDKAKATAPRQAKKQEIAAQAKGHAVKDKKVSARGKVRVAVDAQPKPVQTSAPTPQVVAPAEPEVAESNAQHDDSEKDKAPKK
jgi:RNA polymerase sigma factor (sigma-70 family)